MVAETDACAGEVVNVGGEHETVILDLARTMMRLRGVEAQIVLHPSPAGSVKRRAPNIAKLKTLTGYEERIGLDRGLIATAAFYLEDNLVDALDPSPRYAV